MARKSEAPVARKRKQICKRRKRKRNRHSQSLQKENRLETEASRHINRKARRPTKNQAPIKTKTNGITFASLLGTPEAETQTNSQFLSVENAVS